jgi:hypothetical protein
MGNIMNTHENGAQNSLICSMTPILAPWNIETPSTPNQIIIEFYDKGLIYVIII